MKIQKGKVFMNNKKALFLSLLLFILLTTPGWTQEMKPFAPPLDITGEQPEAAEKIKAQSNNENINQPLSNDYQLQAKENKIKYEDTNVNTLKSDKEIVEVANITKKPDQVTPPVLDKLPVNDNTLEKTIDKIQQQSDLVNNQFSESDSGKQTEKEVIAMSSPPSVASKQHILSDIQKEADLVNHELRFEEPAVLNDLRVLWTAAVEKSTTIRLVIQKLSNPNEGRDEASLMSKILSPLASVAPMAAMASGSATQAAGALIGGGMLGTLSSDVDSEYNKAFMRVSDFDLIMLAKEVDELQSKLVMTYYEYRQALERLIIAEEALQNARDLYHEAQKIESFSANTAADAFYREAQQNHLGAKQNFISARTSLEQITGMDAIIYVEHMREKGIIEQPEQSENIDQDSSKEASKS
jgi:hypothetical protein